MADTWNVSAQTGDFTWSYPLRVPPAPGGLERTGPSKSGSICVEAFIGAGVGTGGEICANVDRHGTTFSGGFKYRFDLGVEAYVAVSVKLNTTDAANQNRDQMSWSRDFALTGHEDYVKELPHLLKTSKVEDPDNHPQIVIKAQYGFGVSVGGTYATHGFNTGYVNPSGPLVSLAAWLFS
ncbi:hypothetical protein ACFQ1S_29785 [Kibdelosporangium lantanae]|uniref:Transporter n=1 Tax=Kibdelosporangium lantanae TaxID=1497396 RepID=A0ABW3MIC5_9PSEU